MSMIKCSECGKEISNKAKVCVHCGNPLKNEEQDNSVNEKKVKIKKNNKTNNILLIILILLIHLILFLGGTRNFLNSDTVIANVIYPVKQYAISRLTTENIYECNIVYEYKGVEYHDKLTFNDDNLPKELKNASTNPYSFDVKLQGYVDKNSVNNFIYDMEYYNISKYAFYIQVILIIPSVWLIIKNIISLRKNKDKSKKGINKVVLISIIFLVAIIVGSVIFSMNKNKDISKYKINNTTNNWGLTNSQDNNSSNSNDYSYNSTDNIDREELIDNLNFYIQRGWLDLTDIERQQWEQCSNVELKQRLDKLDEDIRVQEQYNNKYANQLYEIFKKEIKVELNSSEDTNYKYTPSNKIQPKARIAYVAINEDGINAIYYSIETNLTITNKTNGQSTEKTTTKFYKSTNLQEFDDIIKINNYDTQTIDNELSKATAGYQIDTYHSSGLPYYFYNSGDYVLYYLSDQNEQMLDFNEYSN